MKNVKTVVTVLILIILMLGISSNSYSQDQSDFKRELFIKANKTNDPIAYLDNYYKDYKYDEYDENFVEIGGRIPKSMIKKYHKSILEKKGYTLNFQHSDVITYIHCEKKIELDIIIEFPDNSTDNISVIIGYTRYKKNNERNWNYWKGLCK